MLLFLNDVAGSEILLILVFILIFFGSKSIPGLARTMGRTIRQVKDASEEIQREIKKSGDDMKKELNLKGMIEETAADVKRPLDQMSNDIEEAIRYTPPNRHSHIQPIPEKPKEQDELKPNDQVSQENSKSEESK
jgi:sec-independent protein translocase protein TatA